MQEHQLIENQLITRLNETGKRRTPSIIYDPLGQKGLISEKKMEIEFKAFSYVKIIAGSEKENVYFTVFKF